ncbi:MAG: hypothetical protein IJ180_11650 [Bacteroidales bacterium]|nr:hypothetical protein [Bacteroidales bacterium]MBQ9255412.1 hypothetical protein [Bacteroidales bacterium]
MNKITLKNFFMMLLAGLLIVAMMIMQWPTGEEVDFKFWIGLVIIVCAVIFILYESVVISNKYYKTLTELNNVKTKLKQLSPKPEEKKEENNEVKQQ